MKRIILCTNRVALPAEPPERFQIMPWGKFISNGGPGNPIETLADEETFRLIQAAHKKHGVETRIDFNHQSIDEDFLATGKVPLILGYIANFEMVPGDGIYAVGVTWTPPGVELIKNLQARYPSYVGYIDGNTGRVFEIDSIGLTPNPFIDGIKPVVNHRKAVVNMHEKIESAKWFLNLEATATEQEIIMNFEEYLNQMRAELSLSKDADATAVLNAVKARNSELASVRSAVGVAADAKGEQVVAAVNALKTKPATTSGDSVPKAEFDAVANAQKADREEISKLKSELADRRANERISAARNAGKLTDAMLEKNADGKNHFVTCALTHSDAEWKELIERMPVVSPPSGRAISGGPANPLAAKSSDSISANSDRFNVDRMGDYDRIAKYAADKNVSFEKAMEACGAL